MAHSEEYEREVIATLRLVRGVIQVALVGVGIFALLAVLGLVSSLVFGGRTTTSRGGDVHAALSKGSSISVTTEDGLKAKVRINEVGLGPQGPVLTAKVELPQGAPPPDNNWYLYLDNNTRMKMTGMPLGNGVYRFESGEPLPEGRSVRFVHYNPDESHGDIYFDVR